MKKTFFAKTGHKHNKDPKILDLASKWSTIKPQRKKFHDKWKVVKNCKTDRYDFTGNSKVIVKKEKMEKDNKEKRKNICWQHSTNILHFSGVFTRNREITIKER